MMTRMTVRMISTMVTSDSFDFIRPIQGYKRKKQAKQSNHQKQKEEKACSAF